MERLEQSLQEAPSRLIRPVGPDPRLVLIDIDDASLAELGAWPWGEDRMARLVDALFDQQQVALAGFDLVFSHAGPANESLSRALRQRPVVLGYAFNALSQRASAQRLGVLPAPAARAPRGAVPKVPPGNGFLSNTQALAVAAPAAGFLNLLPDTDGRWGWTPLWVEFDGHHHPSLALAMLQAARPGLAVDAISVRVPGTGGEGGRGPGFEHVSAADLIAGRLPPGALKGRIALVGLSAGWPQGPRLGHVGAPHHATRIHASVLAGLLDGRLPARPEGTALYGSAALVAVGIPLAFALPVLPAVWGAAVCAALLVAMLALHAALLAFGGWLISLAPMVVMIALALLLNMACAYAAEGRSRHELTRLLGTYAPPELAREMVRDPQRYGMKAASKELTVLFCDVRGFTRLAEQMEPAALQALLNGLFTRLTDTLRAHDATIDKYIGDCIMAFWGAPVDAADHAHRAVTAALALVEDINRLNEERRKQGLPDLGVGIGINSGPMCVGDMGSRLRRAYTVIGDAVNLSARLESLSRTYGVAVVAGEATRRLAEGFVWRELDQVRVKGRTQGLAIYEPLPLRVLDEPAFVDELQDWSAFLRAYRAQDWCVCKQLLESLQGRAPGFGLYQLYATRIEALRRGPFDACRDGATPVKANEESAMNIRHCGGVPPCTGPEGVL